MIANCDEPYQLQDVIRDFKRHTAKKTLYQIENEPESRREFLLNQFEIAGNKSLNNKKYKFWQTGNHAIELYSEKFIWDKINYIHNNLVEQKFVINPEDWIFSSASNYLTGKGILKEVYCITPPLKTLN